jgi:hypothetical protein
MDTKLSESRKKTTETIQNQDLFGHLIAFNFDNKGSSHKTVIGGVFSIIIKLLMAAYIWLRIKKLIFLEGADTSVSELLLKVDLHGDVALEDMHLNSFYVLTKQLGGSSVFFGDLELERHLDIHFIEYLVDWNKPEKERK